MDTKGAQALSRVIEARNGALPAAIVPTAETRPALPLYEWIGVAPPNRDAPSEDEE